MLRKSALFAYFAALISYANSVTVDTPQSYSEIAVTVTAVLIGAVMPIFYSALYLSPAPLYVSRQLRRISLAAAFVIGALFILGLIPRRNLYLQADGVGNLLSELSNLATMFLLIALSRQPETLGADVVPLPKLLRRATRVALIVQGIGFVVFLLGMPFILLQMKTLAGAGGLPWLTFGTGLEIYCRSLLDQASVLIVLDVAQSSGG